MTQTRLLEGSNGGLGNQAYEALLDLIISRELKQGDQIQERALALRLGISRTPLREAMHRLEGEKVLERKSNNRLFVRMVTLQEILEILHVRRLLETEAAARSAGKIPLAKLKAVRDRIEKLKLANDPASYEHQLVDAELHGLIASYCENKLLAEMIDELRRKTRMFSLKRVDKRMMPVLNEHMAIITALENDDAQSAALETSRHIDNIRSSIIDIITRY
ncbi:GntR family transcriptional regulator [Sodalis sp. RH21]|uniref:GntR family transcriptional regulator n=1 Tax=unclassified Sodalis (in: enterobacteria) TaxID=2636512 RepID=UPI0039B3C1EE